MLGVLCNHILQSLYADLNTAVNYPAHHLQVFLMSMSIIAVNCFVLISGYFRIKQSWKGFVNLFTQCAFYAITFSAIGLVLHEVSWMDALKRSVFALSESGMWFIVAYFGLYLIAPLLNAGYNNLPDSKKTPMLLMMFILDVYLGYMHQSAEVSVSGYHVIHFIVLYYIGCYISEKPIKVLQTGGGYKWLAICVLCTMMHAIKVRFAPMAILFSFRYNSPMVLLASVTFFHWVTTWKIQNKWINWISASVLSVYLIHSQTVGGKVLFGACHYIHDTFSTIPAGLLLVATVVVFYMCCIFVDKLRIYICSPLNEKIVAKLNKKFTLKKTRTDYLK